MLLNVGVFVVVLQIRKQKAEHIQISPQTHFARIFECVKRGVILIRTLSALGFFLRIVIILFYWLLLLLLFFSFLLNVRPSLTIINSYYYWFASMTYSLMFCMRDFYQCIGLILLVSFGSSLRCLLFGFKVHRRGLLICKKS